MLKKSGLIFAVIFFLNLVTVFATDEIPHINIDYTTKEITIYGAAQPGGDIVTCYVESPAHRVVYWGSADVQNGQYSFQFKIDTPVEGTYYGKLKTENMLEEQSFSFVYALKSGTRICGIEHEQTPPTGQTGAPPELKAVHVELVSIREGIYRFTLNPDDPDECTYASGADPFFFWKATEGTFIDSNEDYTSVLFKVDPNTSGKSIRVVVGMGDRLGRVDYRVFTVQGMNEEL